ncbi:MAG: acyltransferase [Candidatus Acidiferrales bacterium]|jgi:peptidoglycan/LPS O-acetylase OafA/YrhL
MPSSALVHTTLLDAPAVAPARPGLVAPPPVAVAAKPAFHVDQLDGLRGLAALFAVTFHYLAGLGVHWRAVAAFQSFLGVSPVSVDTFFILSGFLIGSILLRAKDSPNYYKTFYMRRVYRILPLYYAWIALYVALFLIRGGWGLTRPAGYATPFVFASFVLMVQNFFPSIIESTYIVAPTWSLALEEHFYLIAPFCVRRFSRRALGRLLAGVIVLAPLFRALIFSFGGHDDAWRQVATYTWTPCHADALALGVLLAIAWGSLEKRTWLCDYSRLLPWAMLALTGIALALGHLDRAQVAHANILNASLGRSAVEVSGLCLLIFVLVRPEGRFCGLLRTRFLRETGKVSYCLYVVHWGMLWMVSRFLFHRTFGSSPWVDSTTALIALGLSYLVSLMSWQFLEHPFIRRAHRYTF